VPPSNRCPQCRAEIHPWAATCSSCGADLDALRRRRGGARARRRLPRPSRPALTDRATELVVLTALMLLLAVFTPLYGVLLALFLLWHGQRTGRVGVRNAAIVACAVALLQLLVPGAIPT
jgi:hypothetical protein